MAQTTSRNNNIAVLSRKRQGEKNLDILILPNVGVEIQNDLKKAGVCHVILSQSSTNQLTLQEGRSYL